MKVVIVSLGPNEVMALKKKAPKEELVNSKDGLHRVFPQSTNEDFNFKYWFHNRWRVILGEEIFTVIGPELFKTGEYHPADGLCLQYDECIDFKILT